MEKKGVCSCDGSPPRSVFTSVYMYQQNWALKRIEKEQSVWEGSSVCKKFQLSEEMKHRVFFFKNLDQTGKQGFTDC